MESTGGCLCGAVRYRASDDSTWASYCHCAMCQKVSGAPFMGFVEFPQGAFTWTEGQPDEYESSKGVIRHFCRKCGSALSFVADGVLFVSLGSLDHPERIEVKAHTYTSAQLPQIKLSDGLPHYPGPAGGKGGRPID